MTPPAQHVRQILAEFGLLSGDPKPIDFRSDASDELGTTLRRAGIPREFTVSKAGPQNHDTVGSVERGVRELKEGLAVLRLELGKAGVDVGQQFGWLGSQFKVRDCDAQLAFEVGWHRIEVDERS